VFLAIVNESNFGLEILLPLLISKLPDMPTRFSGFSLISCFDNICTSAERSEATLAWYQSRVLVSK
jgi:hypothetical protein